MKGGLKKHIDENTDYENMNLVKEIQSLKEEK